MSLISSFKKTDDNKDLRDGTICKSVVSLGC